MRPAPSVPVGFEQELKLAKFGQVSVSIDGAKILANRKSTQAPRFARLPVGAGTPFAASEYSRARDAKKDRRQGLRSFESVESFYSFVRG